MSVIRLVNVLWSFVDSKRVDEAEHGWYIEMLERRRSSRHYAVITGLRFKFYYPANELHIVDINANDEWYLREMNTRT